MNSGGPKRRPIWDEYNTQRSGKTVKAKCKHCDCDAFNRNISTLYAHLLNHHPDIAAKYKTNGTLKSMSLKRKLDGNILSYTQKGLSIAEQESADQLLTLWTSIHGIKYNPFRCPVFAAFAHILNYSYEVPGQDRLRQVTQENGKKIKDAVHYVTKLVKMGPATIDGSSDQCKEKVVHFVVLADGQPMLLKQYRYVKVRKCVIFC